MPQQPLDFDFPLMSEISARPPHAVAPDELLEEIDAELADRRAFYGRLVERGKMDRAEADRHIDLMEAIRDDLRFTWSEAVGWLGQRHGWDAKVRELRRELAIRRKHWPKRIANPADPLDQPSAARRMERLEAVHYKYWIDLFGADGECTEPTMTRAWTWRRWQWAMLAVAASEREALCVHPDVARFLELAVQPGTAESEIWHDYLAAARKHGLAPMEEAAA